MQAAPMMGAGGHMVPFLVSNPAGGFQYLYGNPFLQMIGGIGGVGGGGSVQVPLQPMVVPPSTTGVGGEGRVGVIPPPGGNGGGAGGGQGQVIPPQPDTGASVRDVTDTGETSSRREEDDREEESEEEEEDNTIKEAMLNFMKEMKEARREDRERQERLEERLKKAEEDKSQPPSDRRGWDGPTDRGRENRGTGQSEGERKGQCKMQLLGRQCDRSCQYSHKSMCGAYKEKGWQGCHDKRCNLLHPYDCRSIE